MPKSGMNVSCWLCPYSELFTILLFSPSHSLLGAGVTDAEAYLHERLGNYEAALALHIAHLDAAHKCLEGVVLSGQLPLLQLPTWAAPGPNGRMVAGIRDSGTDGSNGKLLAPSTCHHGCGGGAVNEGEGEQWQSLTSLGAGLGLLCSALLYQRRQQQHAGEVLHVRIKRGAASVPARFLIAFGF